MLKIKLLKWICREFETDCPIYSCEDEYIVLNIPSEVSNKQKEYLEANNIYQDGSGEWTVSF